MSTPRKQVRWKYEVKQYESLRTRDSEMTTPPPMQPAQPVRNRQSSHRPSDSASSSSSFASSASFSSFGSASSSSSFQLSPAFVTLELEREPLPPTPIIHTIPLPDTDSSAPTPQTWSRRTSRNPSPSDVLVDKVLQSDHPLRLVIDFSFPSWYFQASREMAKAYEDGVLDRPVVDSRYRSLEVVFSLELGGQSVRVPVMVDGKDTNDGRDFVTIGALLKAIHKYFRQSLPLGDWPPETLRDVQEFAHRRYNTVNGSASFARAQREANISKERRDGYRVVDMMLGKTRFAGLKVSNVYPDHCELELRLEVPERYQERSEP